MQVEVNDETRYHTESWIAAEREATEAYKRGGLKSFKSVQEMADYIEAGRICTTSVGMKSYPEFN